MATITLSAAQRAITAATEEAGRIGGAYVVTVVDAGVRPILVARQDAAPLVAIEASLSKARTSLYFGGTATADLTGATDAGGPLRGIEHAIGEPLAFIGGAVAVRDDEGAVIGAVGVSGGTAEQDHVIATAAVAAI